MILGGLAAVVVIAVITTAVLVTKKLTGRKQVNPADVKVPEYVKVDPTVSQSTICHKAFR